MLQRYVTSCKAPAEHLKQFLHAFFFFFFFFSVLEHIKETTLDRFGEKKSFGMNVCNKILVMTCLLHYFHFVRLLSNFIPKLPIIMSYK